MTNSSEKHGYKDQPSTTIRVASYETVVHGTMSAITDNWQGGLIQQVVPYNSWSDINGISTSSQERDRKYIVNIIRNSPLTHYQGSGFRLSKTQIHGTDD